jgi:hypothetical protein
MPEYPNRFKEKQTVNLVQSWELTSFVFADSKWDVQGQILGLLTSNKDSLYIMGQCLAGSDKLYSLHMKYTMEADAIVSMLGKDFRPRARHMPSESCLRQRQPHGSHA